MYSNKTKHKVFISFYHHDDQCYKDFIEQNLSANIINKSVRDGEIDTDDSDEYVKRIIREDKVSDSSVIVVLVGPNTKNRKHVDWEISAALNRNIKGNSGLVAVILPEVKMNENNQYYLSDLPARLADNIKSGYAQVYSWDYALDHFDTIIETAFNNRILLQDKIDNRRPQMKRNI